MKKKQRNKKIERVNVRWVSVSAVWQNFMYIYFETASNVQCRHKRISSKQFSMDLVLMYDVIFEFSLLSTSLQNRHITVVQADKSIGRDLDNRIITVRKWKENVCGRNCDKRNEI